MKKTIDYVTVTKESPISTFPLNIGWELLIHLEHRRGKSGGEAPWGTVPPEFVTKYRFYLSPRSQGQLIGRSCFRGRSCVLVFKKIHSRESAKEIITRPAARAPGERVGGGLVQIATRPPTFS